MPSLSLLFVLFMAVADAASLSDLQPFEYDLRFTNPVCATFRYDEPVYSRGEQGQPESRRLLENKPQDVFCSSADVDKYSSRENLLLHYADHPQLQQMLDSPQIKILDWINSATEDQALFLAYLSFSNKVVERALCLAVERGVEVTLVIDKGARPSTRRTLADDLAECESKQGQRAVILRKGHEGGIRFHHFKILLRRQKLLAGDQPIKIAFGSGNMSTGTVLHHENWNFITTNTNSYFAKIHLCVLDGLLSATTSADKYLFRQHVQTCRANMPLAEEDDIQSFFVPGEGPVATDALLSNIEAAAQVDLAAHRFSYQTVINALKKRIQNQARSFVLRLIFDDDLFWMGVDGVSGGYKWRVPNTKKENAHVRSLLLAGVESGQAVEARYMETNHNSWQLHHNKFMIFRGGQLDQDVVFGGGGNFTGSAFRFASRGVNYENYYLISIPEVVAAYKKQYDKMYGAMASSPADLPDQFPVVGGR